MSEPEIAHRCPSCGASIRMRGLFCPQCGKPTSGKKSDSDPQENSAEITQPAGPAETVSVELTKGETTELKNAQPANDQSTTTTQAETVPLQSPSTHGKMPGVEPGKERGRAGMPTKSSLRHRSGTGVRSAVGRARAARDVIEEDVLQGVGKLREISTVVLDGASYDPSLRFLLVAAVLFVMFLLILFLSEVMN